MNIKKIALFIIGIIALVLGAIGIVLPVLPATPFFILSASCFAASSQTMYNWLLNAKYFGEYIRYYKDGAGISEKTRTISIIYLWVGLVISGIILRHPLIIGILVCMGLLVTMFLASLRGRADLVDKTDE